MEIEILSHSHFPSMDKNRLGSSDTLVIFRIDNKRTDTIMLPGAVDDVKVLQSEIAKAVKLRANVVGHKFTL